MFKKIFISGLFIFSIMAGIGIYLTSHDIMIVFVQPKSSQTASSTCKQTKTAICYFWSQGVWTTEEAEIIQSLELTKSIQTLSNKWLALAYEKQHIPEHVSIDSMIISPKNEAYLSFSDYPWHQDDTCYTKLMIIEGLIKTLQANNIEIQACYFLRKQRLFIDQDIDFEHPWPITGFTE